MFIKSAMVNRGRSGIDAFLLRLMLFRKTIRRGIRGTCFKHLRNKREGSCTCLQVAVLSKENIGLKLFIVLLILVKV